MADPPGFANERGAELLGKGYPPSSLQHEGEPEGLRGSHRSCRVIHPHEICYGHAGALEVPLLDELVLHTHPFTIIFHS